MWGITFESLAWVYMEAKRIAGDDFPRWTMDDVSNHVIKPLCVRHGTSYALQQSPGGLHAQVFVSHAWKEPFQQFTRSIFETYETSPTKPTLWICTFALVQSDDEDFIASQIGNAD